MQLFQTFAAYPLCKLNFQRKSTGIRKMKIAFKSIHTPYVYLPSGFPGGFPRIMNVQWCAIEIKC